MSTGKVSLEKTVSLMLRLPPDLHRLVVAAAATAGQSMNTFVVETLARSLNEANEQWRQDAKLEMLRLLEEEDLHEARLTSLRAKRLKILKGMAEREGDSRTAQEIARDLSELERLIHGRMSDLPSDLQPDR